MDFYVRMFGDAPKYPVRDVFGLGSLGSDGRRSEEDRGRMTRLFDAAQKAWEEYLASVREAVEPTGYFSGSHTGAMQNAVESWLLQQRAYTILLYFEAVEEEGAGDVDFLSGGWGDVVPVE